MEQHLLHLGTESVCTEIRIRYTHSTTKYVSMEKSSRFHKLGFSCTFTPYYCYLTRWDLSKEQAQNVPTLRLGTKAHFACSSAVQYLAVPQAQLTKSV